MVTVFVLPVCAVKRMKGPSQPRTGSSARKFGWVVVSDDGTDCLTTFSEAIWGLCVLGSNVPRRCVQGSGHVLMLDPRATVAQRIVRVSCIWGLG